MAAGLLEPRLYRAAFTVVVLALVVLMFSIQQLPRPLPTSLAALEFDGDRALSSARSIESRFPDRRAGTAGDRAAGAYVAAELSRRGFSVVTDRFDGETAAGNRSLVNVVGERAGDLERQIVVLAHRDGLTGKWADVGASETAVLLQLARVFDGRSPRHTIVLVSTDGGVSGLAGARRYIDGAAGLIDAVVVARNFGGGLTARPLIEHAGVDLTSDQDLFQTALAALDSEGVDRRLTEGVGGQMTRMAFPIALGEQVVAGRAGIRTVAFSPGGEPLVEPKIEGAGPDQIAAFTAVGRALLRTVTALDGATLPQPENAQSVVIGNKVVPGWALRLFLLSLIVPILVASLDGFARCLRRARSDRFHLGRVVLAIGTVFALVAAGPVALRLFSIVGVAAESPAAALDHPLLGFTIWEGTVVVVLIGMMVAGFVITILPSLRVLARTPSQSEQLHCVTALLTVAIVLTVWAFNALAAGFIIPLAHLIVLLTLSDANPSRFATVAMSTVMALPLVAAGLYYADRFSLSPLQMVRFMELLIAGGTVPLAWVALWSLLATVAVTSLTTALMVGENAINKVTTEGKSLGHGFTFHRP